MRLSSFILPYAVGSMPTPGGSFGQGSGPIHMNGVGCSGAESRLINCASGSISGCSHAHDVGVRCSVQSGTII